MVLLFYTNYVPLKISLTTCMLHFLRLLLLWMGCFKLAVLIIRHAIKSSFIQCFCVCSKANVIIWRTEIFHFIMFVRFMMLLEGMLRKMRLPMKNGKNIHGNLIFTTFEPPNFTKMKYHEPYTLFGTKETVYF